MKYELERVEHHNKFPIKCMIVSIENSSPHWHYDYEIILNLKGNMNLQLSNVNYDMQEGDIILVNACEIHSLMSPRPGNLCLIMQFDPCIISEEFGDSRTILFNLNTIKSKSISDVLIEEIRETLARLGYTSKFKSDGYQFLIKSYFYKLIYDLFCHTKYIIKNNTKTPVSEDIMATFDKVNEYIKTNFMYDLTIVDLCKDIGISKSSLYRVLKETSLSTYKNLLDYYRIEHAKNLLKNTKNSISYIVSVCGF